MVTCLDALKYSLSFEKKVEELEEDEVAAANSQQSKREINDIMHLQTVFKANNAAQLIDFSIQYLDTPTSLSAELQCGVWNMLSKFLAFRFYLDKKSEWKTLIRKAVSAIEQAASYTDF